MSEAEDMFYVAADPTQPGTAWAACVDDPRLTEYTAKDLAEWVREGATVMRVTPEVAREMLSKWIDLREAKKQTAQGPGA